MIFAYVHLQRTQCDSWNNMQSKRKSQYFPDNPSHPPFLLTHFTFPCHGYDGDICGWAKSPTKVNVVGLVIIMKALIIGDTVTNYRCLSCIYRFALQECIPSWSCDRVLITSQSKRLNDKTIYFLANLRLVFGDIDTENWLESLLSQPTLENLLKLLVVYIITSHPSFVSVKTTT